MPSLLVLVPASPAAINAIPTNNKFIPLRPGVRLCVGRAPAAEQDNIGGSAVLVLSALPVSGRHCTLEVKVDEVRHSVVQLALSGLDGVDEGMLRGQARRQCASPVFFFFFFDDTHDTHADPTDLSPQSGTTLALAITDLGSSNGTFVRGSRVPRHGPAAVVVLTSEQGGGEVQPIALALGPPAAGLSFTIRPATPEEEALLEGQDAAAATAAPQSDGATEEAAGEQEEGEDRPQPPPAAAAAAAATAAAPPAAKRRRRRPSTTTGTTTALPPTTPAAGGDWKAVAGELAAANAELAARLAGAQARAVRAEAAASVAARVASAVAADEAAERAVRVAVVAALEEAARAACDALLGRRDGEEAGEGEGEPASEGPARAALGTATPPHALPSASGAAGRAGTGGGEAPPASQLGGTGGDGGVGVGRVA